MPASITDKYALKILPVEIEHQKPRYVIPADGAPIRRPCYICTWNGLGGTETLILRHIRWLRKNGAKPVVMAPSGKMNDELLSEAELSVELKEQQLDDFRESGSRRTRAMDSLAQNLSAAGPLHFIVFNEIGVNIAAELCSRLRGSALSVYLIFDDIFGPAKLDYFDEMNDHGMVVSMNEACLEGHRRRYGYRLNKSQIVPLPMAVPPLAPRCSGNSECVVLTVARLVEMKGYVEGLIRDVAKLVQVDGHDVKLLIVGDGPCRENLERIASSAGLGSRVVFVGSVPYKDLMPYYGLADVYVGMGTTVLEAASIGVPSLVAIAYTPEFRTHGLFSSNCGGDLGEPHHHGVEAPGIAELRRLVGSVTYRNRAGRACRDKVIKMFNEEEVMRAFLGVLNGSAYRLENLPKLVTNVRLASFRRFIKRCLRHHPIALRFSRRVLRGLEASCSTCSRIIGFN